jgi:glyoxylate reductase
MKIFLTHKIPDKGIELLKKAGKLDIYDGKQAIERTELLKRVRGVNAIVSMLTNHIDAELFDAAGPQLKVVANYAVGFDNIDVREANKRGIAVTNTPGVLTEAVAEHTLGLMFAVGRRIVEADNFTRKGKYKGWMPLGFLGQSMWGKTLGVIGLGRIGTWFAEAAHRGLNMKIMYTDIQHDEELETKIDAKYHKLDSILKEADVISIHVPLLESTHHLIGERELSMMKPNAILINTSRGPVVDEKALYQALKDNKIFGAGLDVYEHEPKIYRGLDKLSNVVLTPHIASATNEARTAMAEIAAKNVIAVLKGEKPLNAVIVKD